MSVLSKTALKALIDTQITANGTNSITGTQLNGILNSMTDSYEDLIPQKTTAQINALTPTLNQLVYNTDRNYLMQYNGSIWIYLVAMFIGTTAEVTAATDKAGQLYYDVDLSALYWGTGGGRVRAQPSDACTCVKTLKVTLSSAQILASNTTPIQLIAAPGAGKLISILNVTHRDNFVTTPYATNTTSKVGFLAWDTYPFDIGFTESGMFISLGESNYRQVENEGIFFVTNDGNPTAGDSTIDIYITYSVTTL